MSPMHDNRYVVLVTSGKNDAYWQTRNLNETIRATEILDYTIPDASWEESKDFIYHTILISSYLFRSGQLLQNAAHCVLLF